MLVDIKSEQNFYLACKGLFVIYETKLTKFVAN
jgi:hypothetical protein